MATVKLKYVHSFRDRGGRVRHYFRRPGYPHVALPEDLNSPAFLEAYNRVYFGPKIIRDKAKLVAPRTVAAAIVAIKQSREFLSLSLSTQEMRRRALDAFNHEYGHLRVAELQRHHVKTMMDAKSATPNAANFRLQVIRWIIEYAINAGWRSDDPTVAIKKIRVRSDGFHAWTDSEIHQYQAHWKVGTKQRLAFDLFLWTGQRCSDVRQLTRDNIVGDRIHLRQQKTGTAVRIPITDELRISLDTIPANQHQLLIAKGAPFTSKGMSNYLARAAQDAGLPKGCSAHGLRKTAAGRLARARCTPHEIMSITGHKSISEVQRYTRDADLDLLAEGAMEKLTKGSNRAGDDQNTTG